MTRCLSFVSLLALTSTLFACSKSSSEPGDPDAPAQVSSSLTRDTSPNVPAADEAALVTGNTTFALDFYQAVGAANAGQNVFFSPYSISIALAMTYAGAGGETATQMAGALDFTLPAAQLHPAFDQLDLSLAALNGKTAPSGSQPLALHIVNSLWGDTGESFEEPFLDTLAVDYGAGIKLEDFAGDASGALAAINGWVADQTEQKITNLLSPANINADTRLVLVDAIYFDASWATPFDPSVTHPAPFTRLDGSQVSVPTMENSNLEVSYAAGDGYQAVEIPYDGQSVVMDIILPAAGTFAAFEQGLSASGLAAILAGLQPASIDLSLPKFSYTGASISLKSTLTGLGMSDAFQEGLADFTAIAADPSLFIGDVVHKASLQVDEGGTVAAAATAVIIAGDAAFQPPGTTVQVNQPFFFAIRDAGSGTLLFAGRIADPSVP